MHLNKSAIRRAGSASDFRLVEHICFRLLPVQILLCAVSAVNGTLSSLFASNYVGAQAMSAVGLYNPVKLFISAMGLMLMGGSQILCGKFIGKNQLEDTQKLFSLDIILSTLFSLLMTLLMVCVCVFDFTVIFSRDAQVRAIFNQYMLGLAIGVLPQILGQQLSGFLSLENKTNRATAASIACLVSTVALNYIFVAVLRLEAFGLALASSIGQWVFFAVQAAYYIRGKSYMKLRVKNIAWKESRSIVSTGLSGALSNGYEAIRSIIVNTLIISFVGSIGLSAFAACSAFLEFFWAIPKGMRSVSRMMISISTGEEDRQTLQDIMRVMFRRYIPLMAVTVLLLSAFAAPIARIYYRDTSDALYRMTVWGFRILPLAMPLTLIRMHFVCYGQASGKQFLVHLLSLLDGVADTVVYSALLVPLIGLNGVFAADVLNSFTTAAAVVIYAWVRNRKFPKTMEELMVIPPDFGVAADSRMDITVRSMEDVVNVSRKVQDFCLERGIDGRRAYFAALAVEEMAGNVVAHGFKKDRKTHSVDLRVSCKENRLILRIKDDCRPFNPADRITAFDPGDPAKNIGIRMMYKLSDDIRYQNILGMNALTIRI